MSRPVPWRRSTAAQRREQRQAFKALKEHCAANPSAETLAARAKSSSDAMRTKAKAKVAGALRGEAIRPFTALQLAKLRPGENDQLKAEVANRLAALSLEERAAVGRNQHLLICCFSVDDLKALAAVL